MTWPIVCGNMVAEAVVAVVVHAQEEYVCVCVSEAQGFALDLEKCEGCH